jgi:hypothetical protein
VPFLLVSVGMKDHEPSSSADPEYKLLRTLGHELFQTETSASWHCRREARRLASSPPAWALLAVADHADGVLRALPALAEQHEMSISAGGHLVGRAFTAIRHSFVDRLIDGERSYRGTLLGIRHGIDVVRLLEHVALVLNDADLANWCEGWLDTRTELTARVEEGLAWFARHPVEAIRSSAGLLLTARG